MTVNVQLKWVEDFQFVARAGDGPVVVIDSHEGGGGASPMELVLMGLGGCTAVDVISIMRKKRADVTRFEVHLTGQRAEAYPRRYTNIHIEYVLYGRGIKPKAVEQAIRLSEEKYCSAMASLNATFDHAYRIVETDTVETK
jgi:putative redox protein